MWLKFDTEQKCITAEQQIANNMNCPITGKNAASAELEPDKQKTLCWAVPHNTYDNNIYWVIPKPDSDYMTNVVDYVEEAVNINWWEPYEELF
jgi:hypothetical protein